jgi:hypothetical protein
VVVELKDPDGERGFRRWVDVVDAWHAELKPRLSWPVDLQWYHVTETPHVCRHVAECCEVVYPPRQRQSVRRDGRNRRGARLQARAAAAEKAKGWQHTVLSSFGEPDYEAQDEWRRTPRSG